MLRWQHENVRNSRAVWAHCMLVSAVLHGIALCLLLFVYSDRISHYVLTMSSSLPCSSAVVVLAPASTLPAARAAGNGGKSVASKQPSTHIVKAGVLKKSPPVAQKLIKKKKLATAQTVKKKPQKIKPKPAQKKQKIVEKPIAVAKPVNEESSSSAPPIAQADKSVPVEPGSETVAIAYTDARLAHQYIVLQQEVSKQWAPPPGVSDETTAKLTVVIDRAGAVQDVRVEESSGVLIFDITARSALLAVVWPVWTWGASITITFKP